MGLACLLRTHPLFCFVKATVKKKKNNDFDIRFSCTCRWQTPSCFRHPWRPKPGRSWSSTLRSFWTTSPWESLRSWLSFIRDQCHETFWDGINNLTYIRFRTRPELSRVRYIWCSMQRITTTLVRTTIIRIACHGLCTVLLNATG